MRSDSLPSQGMWPWCGQGRPVDMLFDRDRERLSDDDLSIAP